MFSDKLVANINLGDFPQLMFSNLTVTEIYILCIGGIISMQYRCIARRHCLCLRVRDIVLRLQFVPTVVYACVCISCDEAFAELQFIYLYSLRCLIG